MVGHLAAGRSTLFVSGTNGKTTTTRLLAAALEAGGSGLPVITNATGSNMPAGHAAALAVGPPGAQAVLEVDEGYLPALLRSVRPVVVVLLNLSRDQLDRSSEVRMVARRWHDALQAADTTTVVANADEPLVVWGASGAARLRWVAAGTGWRADATGCPACGGTITFDGTGGSAGWSCPCGFSRPELDAWIEDGPRGPEAVWAGGERVRLELAIPGAFNRANAVLAATAAGELGVGHEPALAAMAEVREVAGRFTTRDIGGVRTRMLLAKNPAGWSALLDLLAPQRHPVVIGINARVADGRDPSWLWDVAFERLAGRRVVATGERCLDLSVRLRYADVSHDVVSDQRRAVITAGGPGRAAGGAAGSPIDYVGNYTAFHELLRVS
jgi:UDP-N-acetylmuramyl tripeptide synthase